tara:strand:- start:128207 stop:128986 length:780 start_codon:yes stop_codon:yes gene_type:complete
METAMTSIEALNASFERERKNVVEHELYGSIKSSEHLAIFMRHHVYAVWDFMTLLKSLQNELTCTTTPWYPKGNADTRYLINEIVIDEESDVDQNGQRKSHFEMYLDAMKEVDANRKEINSFLDLLQQSTSTDEAFETVGTPESVRELVKYTLDVALNQPIHVKAAVFTFGREDLIPEMFLSIVEKLFEDPEAEVGAFKYYLERHIEVDGGHHSELAQRMTSILCGDDEEKWKEAETAVKKALELRAKLWDGVLSEIRA